MIVYYQNKFKKIFGLSVALILVVVFYLVALINETNKEDFNVLFFQQVNPLMTFIVFTGSGLYLWSHYLLAKAKGYSGWLVLLGFLNVIGLAILILLPDKRKGK